MDTFVHALTSKGKACIFLNGRKYRFVRVTASGEKSWRCTTKNCNTYVNTNDSVTIILSTLNEHACDKVYCEKDIQKCLLVSSCAKRATEDLAMRPSKIIRNTLMDADTNALSYDDIGPVKQIYRKRRAQMPTVPKSREECIDQLRKMTVNTNNDELFCHVFEDIVILTCKTNLQYLLKHGKILLGDGTFYSWPRHFAQLYTIHSFASGVYRQLIYCFLPSKTTECYVQMWKHIQELAGHYSSFFIS